MRLVDLRDGDLLFCHQKESRLSRAIHTSTGTYTHVGIYFKQEVYHASPNLGVARQSLVDFLIDYPKPAVYRAKSIQAAQLLPKMEEHLGKPYNLSFYAGDPGLYCSEYVAEVFDIFDTVPMVFSEGDQPISDYWQNYFHKLQKPVPIGQPGTNPTQLSQSDHLTYLGELDD